MTSIGARWDDVARRPAGFDYMRIILASVIVVWHSYQVVWGSEIAVDTWETTFVGYFVGPLLPMFFALSGFLVAGSMYRNPNLKIFLTLRVIRIYPALVVETVLSAFLLGPILTIYAMNEYFSDREFLLYLTNTIGWVHYRLPGLFLDNPVSGIVNGQLWTVPFELECYVLIAVISLVGFFRHQTRIIPIFLFVIIAAALWNIASGVDSASPGGWNGRVLIVSFLAGVVVFAFKDKIPWRIDLGLVALIVGTAIVDVADVLVFLSAVLIAYATVVLGLLNPKRSFIINSGDYSYGIYLYHFPLLQAVYQLIGGTQSVPVLLALTFPPLVLFSLFSWWCIEKPFMKVKKFVLAKKPETLTTA